VDDLRAALRPLVDQPSAAPPGLDEIAARAGRRRSRRRAAQGTVAALALVGVLGLAGTTVLGGEDASVRTADAPTTAATSPGDTLAPEGDRRTAPTTTSRPEATPTTAAPPPTTGGTGGDGGPPEGPDAPAPPTTLPPPRPTGPYEPFAGIEAEDWGDARGVGAVAVDGGAAVTAPGGAWLRFPDVRFGTGLSTAVEVVAAPGAAAGPGAVVEVRLDDVASPPFATIAVPAGDAGAFVTLTGATSAIGGTHDVYVTFASPRPGDLARVDRFVFVP
jgi:Carbohydrate binding module (family 6)